MAARTYRTSCSTVLSKGQRGPMSLTTNPAVVPDKDNLPLKKRDQRWSSPPAQFNSATFKVPFPHRSHSEFNLKQHGPLQPIPKRVPALYHPWMQTHRSTRFKPQVLSAFRNQHGWAGWRESNPHHFGLDRCRHPCHTSGTPTLSPAHPQHSSISAPTSLVSEGFQGVSGGLGWEPLRTLRDKSLNPEKKSVGRSTGPDVRRDGKFEHFPRVEKASPPSLRTCPPQEELSLLLPQDEQHRSAKLARHVVPGPTFTGDRKSSNTHISMKEQTSGSPACASSEQAFASPSSPNRFPWLLPHFVSGSLIELRDGRLRRVEHLQTEDFLLGSLACPDLRLSSCTVQKISPSASSSSLSRLLILLHEQQSQELVDVYVEYPFFVQGRGWSSCSPQGTARLCGLQCHQLSVGDVCLALIPLSDPQPPPSAMLEPKASLRTTEGARKFLNTMKPQTLSRPEWPAGEKMVCEVHP